MVELLESPPFTAISVSVHTKSSEGRVGYICHTTSLHLKRRLLVYFCFIIFDRNADTMDDQGKIGRISENHLIYQIVSSLTAYVFGFRSSFFQMKQQSNCTALVPNWLVRLVS